MNKIPAGCRKGVCPSMQVLNREAQRRWRRTVQWKEELLEHNVKHNELHALPEASPFCRGSPPHTHTYCPLFGLILSLVRCCGHIWLLSFCLFSTAKTPFKELYISPLIINNEMLTWCFQREKKRAILPPCMNLTNLQGLSPQWIPINLMLFI